MNNEKVLTQQEFEALSEKDQRIQIAKDVLKIIRIPKESCAVRIKSSYGYIRGRLKNFAKLKGEKSLQTVLKEGYTPEQPCTVCARGAMLYAKVCNYNAVSVDDLEASDAWDNTTPVNSGRLEIHQDDTCLVDCFDDIHLQLIERAFENWSKNTDYYTSKLDGGEFMYRHLKLTDTQRLELIMENIIENDGTFIWKTNWMPKEAV